MANLPETPDYPAGVYQLETSDPVLGGPGGISNRQAEQLANRTAWLKAKVDAFIDGTVAVLKATKLATARTLSISGAGSGSAPFDGSADANIVLTLADSGAVAGTYPKVSVNAKGIVTGGAALAAGDIPVDLALAGNPTAPTAAQFDNDMSLANTAHVQRALGSIRDIVAYSASQVLSAADVGKLVLPNSAGAITLTLPLSSSLAVGATIHLRNAAAGLASLVCSGADIFYRAGLSAPYSTLKLVTNDSVSLVASATGWELLAGSAALRASTGDFAASIAAAGYEKLPSGRIMQWGWTAAANAGDLTQTLPIPFPNEFLHVFITQAYTAGSGSIGYAAANPAGLSSFVWRGSASGNGFRFLAIGR